MLDEETVRKLPRVKEFYSGRTVLVTGFTGFIGKVTVEKLLWISPDIQRIYVLMRPKKNLSVEQRVKKILNYDTFDRLKQRDGEVYKNKVVPVEGDLKLPNLGISDEIRQRIMSDASLIFHIAATVRFDEYLADSIDTNLKGTKHVIDFALAMEKLDVFVYVSTAYANCDKSVVEEKIYDPPTDWTKTLEIRDKTDEATLNILSDKYKNEFPNTYVFTKNLAEHVVNDFRDRLPVLILRPSIVTSSILEPFCGYIENLNGPVGVTYGCGSGVLRSLYAHLDKCYDYVPVDMTVRYMLMVTLIKPYQQKGSTPVYQATTRSDFQFNNLKISLKYMKDVVERYPLKLMFWKPIVYPVESWALFYLYFVLFQLVPSLIIDSALKLFGQKPRLIAVQKRIYSVLLNYIFFFDHEFDFKNRNGYMVDDYIHPDDKNEMHYAFKESEIDYADCFVKMYLYGAKRFFRHTEKHHQFGRKLKKTLTIMDAIFKNGFYLLLGWYVYKHELLQAVIRNSYNFIFNFS